MEGVKRMVKGVGCRVKSVGCGVYGVGCKVENEELLRVLDEQRVRSDDLGRTLQ